MCQALMRRAGSVLSCAGCCCCCLGLLQLKALRCSSCVLCFHYLQILHAPMHLRFCSCHIHTLQEHVQALHKQTYLASQCELTGMSLLSKDGLSSSFYRLRAVESAES